MRKHGFSLLVAFCLGTAAFAGAFAQDQNSQPAYTLHLRITSYHPDGTLSVSEETRYVASNGARHIIDRSSVGLLGETFVDPQRGRFTLDQGHTLTHYPAEAGGPCPEHTAEYLRSQPDFVRTETVLGIKAYVRRSKDPSTGALLGEVYYAPELGCWPLMETQYRDGKPVRVSEPTSISFGEPEAAMLKLPDLPVKEHPSLPVPLPQGTRDARLVTLDGESFKLSDYDGKVLVINIWATWCGPCRLEMPELVKLNNEYQSRGLVVIGLASTANEHHDPAQVKEFIREQNINYTVIWDDGTLASQLVELVNGRAVIPQSFVISRNGNIVKHFQGFNPSSTPPLVRQAVEQALAH